MYSTLSPALITALFVSGIVLAQSSSSPALRPLRAVLSHSSFDERFKTADTDGDGALTQEEAQAGSMTGIAGHFDEIDTNKDGKVTLEEFRAYLRRNLRARPMV